MAPEADFAQCPVHPLFSSFHYAVGVTKRNTHKCGPESDRRRFKFGSKRSASALIDYDDCTNCIQKKPWLEEFLEKGILYMTNI